jgi:hypothetical protein
VPQPAEPPCALALTITDLKILFAFYETIRDVDTYIYCVRSNDGSDIIIMDHG